MAEQRKLGRAPRGFDATIPHMSALAMGVDLAPPPKEVHWTEGKNIDWGMMLNDHLGDCTIAAAYHAMQLWSSHSRDKVLTEPDRYVEQTYRQFAGYDGTPATDNGAMEQDVLRQWLNNGVNIQEGATKAHPKGGVSKIRFFGEVDPRLHEDIRRAINDCGMVYIGFEVPQWLMEGEVPAVWDSGPPSRGKIVGGHAIILTGYETDTRLSDVVYDLVSWGGEYKMTRRFFDTYVDEIYACSHPWWIDATGKTPLGKSSADLVALMKAQQRRR